MLVRPMWRFRITALQLFVLANIALSASTHSRAEQPPENEAVVARTISLKEMRSAVEAIKITEDFDRVARRADLIQEPVFRYSDEQRKIRDATMWVWTIDGRPVSVVKLERYGLPDPATKWLYNAASISPNPLEVQWPFDHRFRTSKPGLDFQPLKETKVPAGSKLARLATIKQMARRFTATMHTGKTNKTEMRMLTTPLLQYASESSGILDGALFGFSATGTNPDAILAIQLRGSNLKSANWEFGVIGMTRDGLDVRHDEHEVWSQPEQSENGQLFDNWTWFFSDRAK